MLKAQQMAETRSELIGVMVTPTVKDEVDKIARDEDRSTSSIEDYIEDRIDLADYLTPAPEKTFLVRVEGSSMVDAGIFPGDLLVVERGSEAKNGDVVIALIGNQFTVKTFRKYRGALSLVSANPDFPKTEGVDFSVWGVVKHAIHSL